MTINEQIEAYISSQPEVKQMDLRMLHERILQLSPDCRQWFTDGKNEEGKVVANPNIGYGAYTIKYADGTTKEFFRIGLSANTAGLSVYVMGLADKSHLVNTYAPTLGKAKITGYCIRFKGLKDINLDVLLSAVQYGFDSED